MPILGANDIANYAKAAGVSDTATATAIALAESRGNTTAHNSVPPDNSYGLWQINMLAHTTKELNISQNSDLYDPMVNANAMAKISNGGTNWKPWTTYTSGEYKLFLDKANAGVTATGGTVQDASAVSDPFGPILKDLTDKNTWMRVGYMVGGFVLIVLALVLIVGMDKVKSVSGIAQIANAAKGG